VKPTVESLFGPDIDAKNENTLSAAQVLGENPPPKPVETKPDDQEPE
jgi:hypothetical protein